MRGLRGLCVLLVALATGAAAQSDLNAGTPVVNPTVLVVDNERLYSESQYGQQIRAELLAAAEELSLENARIVADLTEEEKSLTARRADMDPEAFRAEADAFDQKVQEIRAARDAKEQDIQRARASALSNFVADVRPLLGQLMIQRGATVVLDSRSVLVFVSIADITDEAIAIIDASFAAAQDVPAQD